MAMAPGARDLLESLKSLGLTKYEALVYMALMKLPGASATGIHEASGVPRASVYPVLDRLLQKSLVSVSNTTPKRFSAVPPEDGVRILMDGIESDARSAREQLETMYNTRQALEGGQELIWSVYGDEKIEDRLADLFRHSERCIRIVAYEDFLTGRVRDHILNPAEGVSLEIVTNHWAGPSPAGTSIYVTGPEGDQEHTGNLEISGGVFIFDAFRVMVVIKAANEGLTGMYSESAGFYRFFSAYWDFFREKSINLKIP